MLHHSSLHSLVRSTHISHELPTTFFRVQAETYTKTRAIIKFQILLYKEAYRTNIQDILSTTV